LAACGGEDDVLTGQGIAKIPAVVEEPHRVCYRGLVAIEKEGGVGRLVRPRSRMVDLPMGGVSTRQYRSVIPEMTDMAGVSKSSVSRRENADRSATGIVRFARASQDYRKLKPRDGR
jgi:hypothetical protein